MGFGKCGFDGSLFQFYVRFSASDKSLFVFYCLLATANICNVVLMRNHELFAGIEVKDKDGNVVGTSKIAARKVIAQIIEKKIARTSHSKTLLT